MTNGAAIRRAVDRHDPSVVLVDYFETLVTRTVPTKAVKRIVARHQRDRFDRSADVDRFHDARLRAEDVLAQRSLDAGLDPEHELEALAAETWQQLQSTPDVGSGSTVERFTAAAVAIELQVERLAQVLDRDVVDTLKREVGRRRLVVVSDFHLPEKLFRQQLRWHGIEDLFDDVFVSCDRSLSKASGRLYDHVLAELGDTAGPVEADRVLMIGDNPISDIEQAARRGLHTVRIVRDEPAPALNRLQRRWWGSPLERQRRVAAILADRGETDFAELAVTLFVFVRTLHERAVADGRDPLLFLAREGRFLRTLFDLYQELSPAAAAATVGSEYLLVSRRSTALASRQPLAQEEFASILRQYPEITTTELTASLGLGDHDGDFGPAGDRPVDVSRLRADEGFARSYEEARTEQRTLLGSYVEGLTGSRSTPLHLVDVGWKGTMQDHLQAVFGAEREVEGLYLGVVVESTVTNDERKFGLLFDSRHPDGAFRILRHFKSLYEYLLQADHGSVSRYQRQADNEVVALLDDQPEEAELFPRLIGPVQAGVVPVFAELCREDGLRDHPLVADTEEAAWFHGRMLYRPRRSEVKLIRSLRHYENYGPMVFIDAGEIEEPTGLGKLKALADLVRHPRRLLAGGWPPLALSAMGLQRLTPVLGAYRTVREFVAPRLVRTLTRSRRGPSRNS